MARHKTPNVNTEPTDDRPEFVAKYKALAAACTAFNRTYEFACGDSVAGAPGAAAALLDARAADIVATLPRDEPVDSD